MKKRPQNNLRGELKSAGASASEITKLTGIASNLKRLKNSKSPSSKPILHGQRPSRWKAPIPLGLTSLAGLILGMALVIFSQTVLPGSRLYPVQKLSDNVAVAVHPDYRGVVMMKRAQEVKQLVAQRANLNTVLATLTDYKNEAAIYKSVSTNYAAFEYCKSNLQQAAQTAPNPERQAIDNTLLSLKNV
jgi:hypothetical protein